MLTKAKPYQEGSHAMQNAMLYSRTDISAWLIAGRFQALWGWYLNLAQKECISLTLVSIMPACVLMSP